MPIYEFFCNNENCNLYKIVCEINQRMSDTHEQICPICDKKMVRKYSFIDQYKGRDFTKSADEKESKDVWKDNSKIYSTPK
jgi:hypothetical protein